MEEELSKEWKEKTDRLLSAAQDKHQRALAEVQEERQQLETKLANMEAKVCYLTLCPTVWDIKEKSSWVTEE